MRKVFTKAKIAMKNLCTRIKPVIVKGIKLVCKIIRRVILILSMLAFFIIPFLNSSFDNYTAQCIWYPAFVVMMILLIRESFRKDELDCEENVLDRVGKLSWWAILFTFLSIFVIRYYHITHI